MSEEQFADLATRRGWGWPLRSRKAHYFVATMSMCRRWSYAGALTNEQGGKGPDDCVACRRLLDAHNAAELARQTGVAK